LDIWGMNKIRQTLRVIASMLILLAEGCAFDLTAVRPGETLQISARPTASPPSNTEVNTDARSRRLPAAH
jgi:hypothetical protein